MEGEYKGVWQGQLHCNVKVSATAAVTMLETFP